MNEPTSVDSAFPFLADVPEWISHSRGQVIANPKDHDRVRPLFDLLHGHPRLVAGLSPHVPVGSVWFVQDAAVAPQEGTHALTSHPGTATGRVSSVQPNLGQSPSRSPAIP